MTPAAECVLYLALVCSTVSVVSMPADNNNNNHRKMENAKETVLTVLKKDINTENLIKNSATNVFNPRINDVDNLTVENNSNGTRKNVDNKSKKHDKFYTDQENVIIDRHLNIYEYKHFEKARVSSVNEIMKKNRVRRDEKANKCDSFTYEKGRKFLSHPRIGDSDNVNYSGNTYCTTVIRGPEKHVVQLTFIEMFHIEDHPQCNYDYLEVRDGDRGYYNLLGKVCGDKFPSQITTNGPYAWLKFYSDDTIEYKGFRIQIDFIPKDSAVSVPQSCVTSISGNYGRIDSTDLNADCKFEDQPLDYLWSIDVPHGHKIYLNFTTYMVGEPNECDKNFVQVFGNVLEYDEKLVHYCGSVANPVTTIIKKASKTNEDDDHGNIMHVRLFALKEQRAKTSIDATFTAYRTLDLSKNNTCDAETEFDCEDNTCIDIALRCNNYANCRLKADEEKDLCKHTTQSLMQDPRIQLIVSIFCVILCGISFVFFFKCTKKLYNDHKTIKEQIRQSSQDKLDSMIGSQLVLDVKRLQREKEPRASLERDNQTNEKNQQRKQQKAKAQQRPSSIDSDFNSEIHEDFEGEFWGSKANDIDKMDDVKIEHKAKSNKKDEQDLEKLEVERNDNTTKKEVPENFRKKEELVRRNYNEEIYPGSEIREMALGTLETKQSGCQTRDSLFQTEPIICSAGSGNAKNRSLSRIRNSNTVLPSPPQIKPSEITIEIIRPIPQQANTIFCDRRPMSAETTKSAPDVIILAKPTL